MRLVDEGKLDLDTPLVAILPELRLTRSGHDRANHRAALAHSLQRHRRRPVPTRPGAARTASSGASPNWPASSAFFRSGRSGPTATPDSAWWAGASRSLPAPAGTMPCGSWPSNRWGCGTRYPCPSRRCGIGPRWGMPRPDGARRSRANHHDRPPRTVLRPHASQRRRDPDGQRLLAVDTVRRMQSDQIALPPAECAARRVVRAGLSVIFHGLADGCQ